MRMNQSFRVRERVVQYVPISKAMDHVLCGWVPSDRGLEGTPYQYDSVILEIVLCPCGKRPFLSPVFDSEAQMASTNSSYVMPGGTQFTG